MLDNYHTIWTYETAAVSIYGAHGTQTSDLRITIKVCVYVPWCVLW